MRKGRVRFSRFAFTAGAIATCSLGCGNDVNATDSAPPDEPDAPVCSVPGDSFSPGLTKTSDNGMTVSIDDANPAPPALGKNQWRVKVKDAAGTPIAGATMVLSLYMPPPHDHMQPGTLGVDKGEGNYDLPGINLVMPGVFNITIAVASEGRMESVVFQFCVQRKGN